MKYMGGWSCADLDSCPHEYFAEIVQMINEEIDAANGE